MNKKIMKCQATLKNGKKCKYNAKCDGYCDIHATNRTLKQKIVLEKSKPIIDQRVRKLIEINKGMPEQRTANWFKIRYESITASDAAKAILLTKYELDLRENEIIHIKTKNPKLGSCCYTSCNIKQLYAKKCLPQAPYKKMFSPAILHGTKYECVACKIYEHRETEKVLEFGLMPHPIITFLAASPDGITHSGRMLEIKVPYSREIIGIPLIYYWVQMQMQMQCCQLDVCDFVECKISEYSSEEEYLEDTFQDEYSKSSIGQEKGCLIILEDLLGDGSYDEYHCSPMELKNHDEMEQWISKTLIEIVSGHNGKHAKGIVLHDGQFDVKMKWWYLEKYSKVEVKRDDVWFEKRLPDFERFWKNVELYRKNGLPETCKPKTRTKVKKPAKCMIVLDNDNK